jgi:uncharacterized membrane-anchored protein YhcB (DUF1043 family)
METKKIIGIVILGVSVGALVYLYKGFLKPRLEVDKEFNDVKASLTTNK